jgi:ATP-binding cassette, subfamily F, member 3
MEVEELLEVHHKELIEVSNAGDSSKLMELSKLVSDEEKQVEDAFEELEVAQTELDEINEEYEQKMAELD